MGGRHADAHGKLDGGHCSRSSSEPLAGYLAVTANGEDWLGSLPASCHSPPEVHRIKTEGW